MVAQTILDRSVAMCVLPSAIFTADTFAKILTLQNLSTTFRESDPKYGRGPAGLVAMAKPQA
jgi:hypothetical protein